MPGMIQWKISEKWLNRQEREIGGVENVRACCEGMFPTFSFCSPIDIFCAVSFQRAA